MYVDVLHPRKSHNTCIYDTGNTLDLQINMIMAGISSFRQSLQGKVGGLSRFKKNSGDFNGIPTHDLCDAGAALLPTKP